MNTALIKNNALFLIDGSYLLYRSYFALQTLHTSNGIPTQAIFGFCKTLHAILETFKPEQIAVIWDSKGGSFRNQIYPEYKAHRQAPPSDLLTQKETIIEFLKLINMPCIAQPGFEADDIIASLARSNNHSQTILLCADKDMYQLLSPSILVGDIFKDKLVDYELFSTERGFKPEKIPFLYALLGDASDNIPGVKGIGEKTAQELLSLFDSLHDLYEHIERVPRERIKNLLLEQKANAFLSLELFTLNCSEFVYDPNKFSFNRSAWNNAEAFFTRYEFKSLLKTIQQKPAAPIITATTQTVQTDLFAPQSLTVPTQPTSSTILVNSLSSLKQCIATLEKESLIALDTETTGLRPLEDAILGISCATQSYDSWYINLNERFFPTDGSAYTQTEALALLKPLLENANIKKILHNAKFDALVLHHQGIKLEGITFDTLLAANTLRKPWQKINLKDLSAFYLHEPMQTYADLLGKQRKTFADIPPQEAASYAGHDALQTFKLYTCFTALLEQEPTLHKFYTNLEMPCLQVLMAMEEKGILFESTIAHAIKNNALHELASVEQKILAALPASIDSADFNIQSPRQIEELLFDHLKLPVTKKSPKGARSTDQEVLEELGLLHPVPNLIIQYRELAKLISTYLEPLPTYVNPTTKRIHTSFNQFMAATGRLSSSDPNLQNIPTNTEYGKQLRAAFVAAPGCQFIAADYSQIELRVLAELTNDHNLVQAFLQHKDIHTQTAAELFGVTQQAVTTEQRQLGKRINFSVIYGLTAYGLSKDLGIKPSDAKEYITRYFAQYPTVKLWMDSLVADATAAGYVTTWAGKRRYVPELREKNRFLLEAGKRVAVNTPVQGTAADIMKLAMIKLHHELIAHNYQARILLQIHDELLIEAPEHELAAVQQLTQKVLSSVVQWRIPLEVSLRTGATWAAVTK